jgi:hypothetical protein
MSLITGFAVYAQVHRPSKYGTYDVALVFGKKEADELKKQGLKVQPAVGLEFPDGSNAGKWGDYMFRFRQKIETPFGQIPPPKVVDKDQNPFTDNIGNGSRVTIQYKLGDWNFQGRKGVSAYLQAVQVLNHVPYEKADKPLEFGQQPANKVDSPFDDSLDQI